MLGAMSLIIEVADERKILHGSELPTAEEVKGILNTSARAGR